MGLVEAFKLSDFWIEILGDSGFATGSTSVDCCDFPHPTNNTTAIVVKRRRFISLQLSGGGVGWFSCVELLILHSSYRRTFGGAKRFQYDGVLWHNPGAFAPSHHL